jgi:copper/silver efflux system protein
MPPGLVGFSNIISKSTLRRIRRVVQALLSVVLIWGRFVHCRISSSGTSWRLSKAWLKSRALGALFASINVGGKVIEENGMEFVVRGIGLVNSLDNLRRIAVRSQDGLPIYLEDIAEISMGGDFRRGALDVDGREVVGGVVVMRTGENAMQVIERVKQKIKQIAPSGSIRGFVFRVGLSFFGWPRFCHAR